MTKMITAERWTSELLAMLEETFERVQGMYLDKGTSLFETLADVSAAEASRPLSEHCASLAAQVTHVRYYMEVLSSFMRQQPPANLDWPGSWRREAVTPAEWDALRQELRATYQQVRALFQSVETWEREDELGGAFAIVVHTAYHLGEIRQALGMLRAVQPTSAIVAG